MKLEDVIGAQVGTKEALGMQLNGVEIWPMETAPPFEGDRLWSVTPAALPLPPFSGGTIEGGYQESLGKGSVDPYEVGGYALTRADVTMVIEPSEDTIFTCRLVFTGNTSSLVGSVIKVAGDEIICNESDGYTWAGGGIDLPFLICGLQRTSEGGYMRNTDPFTVELLG